jgi:uncharacterized protein YciI
MPYLVYALDHDGMNNKREEIRNEHRKYLKSYGNKIIASGALLDEDKETVIGGITLLDVENKNEAIRFEQEDPYAKLGIRKDVNIVYWRKRWFNGEFLLKDVQI